MSESPAPTEQPQDAPKKPPAKPHRSRLRRWTRRVTKLLLLALVVLFCARTYYRITGNRELSAVTAKLDAEDPGWQLADLTAAREKAAPPETENSVHVINRVRAVVPKERVEWRKEAKPDGDPVPLNRCFRIDELFLTDDQRDATREARDLGLTLRNFPRGYNALDYPEPPILVRLPFTERVRVIVDLMRTDAIDAAQSGKGVHALRATHASLNVGRSLGDEPLLISQLVRMACGVQAAESAMRVLALHDPMTSVTELTALRVALAAEAEEPLLLNALRGERAVLHASFESMDSLNGVAPSRRVEMYLLRSYFPGDRAKFLQIMSGYVTAAKLPAHQLVEAMQQVERDHPAPRGWRYRATNLMLPPTRRVIEANLRHKALLRSASVLIACEQFRLARGKWPESLAELPKELLPTIPLDPYTGEPVKFTKLTDGIAVYTVGAGNEPEPTNRTIPSNPLGGKELGWRLYDPQHRGLPPLPKTKPQPKPADPVPRPDGPP